MKKQVICWIFIFLWVGCCTSKKMSKKGDQQRSHYHFRWLKRNVPADSASVTIQAQTMRGAPLKCFHIKLNQNITLKDSCSGQIKRRLDPGNYQFSAYMIGFDSAGTSKFFIGRKDSLIINFYLVQREIRLR